MAVGPPVLVDFRFALATVPTGPDEAGRPPPQVLRATGQPLGVLLIAEGLAWTVGTLAYSATYIPAASEIAALTGFLGYAIGGHILLSYPTGRLRSRSDRVLVALLYLACGP